MKSIPCVGCCNWRPDRALLRRQGWDVMLQRMRECKAALQAAQLPDPEAETSRSSLFPEPVSLDAQSGLLALEVVATSHRGKRSAKLPCHRKSPNMT